MPDLICPTCGVEFHVPPSAARRGRRHCSHRCRPRSGALNPKWRGGRVSDGRGRTMVYAPGEPEATMFGGTHAYEYRLVAARMLGRPLRPDEIVHHKNGDVTDNRPENLVVMTQSQHCSGHMAKLTIEQVREIRSYGPLSRPELLEVARHFGVAEATVRSVITRRSWGKVA